MGTDDCASGEEGRCGRDRRWNDYQCTKVGGNVAQLTTEIEWTSTRRGVGSFDANTCV